MDISVNKSFWLTLGSVLGIGLLAVVGIWHSTTPEAPPLSVLFIGNSYTAVNSMPDLFADVAESAGFARPAVKAYTPGAKTLGGHLSDARTRSLIHDGPAVGEQWDVVVLQEQSEMPVAAQANPAVNKSFLDGAAGLYELVKESNPVARVILFETWARHAAWWSSGHAEAARDGINPADMMQRLKTGYEQASQTMAGPGGLPVPIARVGELWAINYNSDSPIMLHAPDGSHPNLAGSYVAALDIFSTIYHASPQNVKYRGTLPRAEAAALRSLVSRNFPNIQAGSADLIFKVYGSSRRCPRAVELQNRSALLAGVFPRCRTGGQFPRRMGRGHLRVTQPQALFERLNAVTRCRACPARRSAG